MPPLHPRSLFQTFVLRLADRLADRLTREHPDRDAAYLAMVGTICSIAAEVCGGEWVYVPRVNVVERHLAHERITLALESGESSALIAKREGVDPSLVRRLRRRRGTIGP